MMDDGWWMMDDEWWMMDDGRWTMDDWLWKLEKLGNQKINKSKLPTDATNNIVHF